MAANLSLQSTWDLTDHSLSYLDEFDHLPSLDLLSELDPASPAPQAAFSEHLVNDAALHIASGTGSAGSDAGNEAFEPKAQQTQQARQKAQEKAKDLNKAAQKRFREKQKGKWQRLQEELSASTAAADRLKCENEQLNNRIGLLQKAATLRQSEQSFTTLSPQVMARPSLSNSMLHGRWGGRDTMHSTVNHADEVITMYQIARMAPQQIAVIWQDYVRELAICMVLGGESLQHDLNNPNGIRLTQLHGELCALCSAKARCNLQAHRQFVSQPLLPTAPDTDASPKPDWLTLAHGLKLSEGQLKDLFMLRRAYLQKQALIQFQQQDLQMQMTEAHSVNSSRLNTLTVGQAAQQIQENDVLLQEAFMQYSGLVCDGVLTVWQAAMALVSTFPHPPEVLTDLIDALADEADEPNFASIQATVREESAIELAQDSWMSIQNHIYKNKSRSHCSMLTCAC